MVHSPCFFISPCWSPLLPSLTPFYLLGTLLAVTGSVHLGLRLLVNWPPLSQPFPQTLPPPTSQNPGTPCLTKTTSRRILRLLSGTVKAGPSWDLPWALLPAQVWTQYRQVLTSHGLTHGWAKSGTCCKSGLLARYFYCLPARLICTLRTQLSRLLPPRQIPLHCKDVIN